MSKGIQELRKLLKLIFFITMTKNIILLVDLIGRQNFQFLKLIHTVMFVLHSIWMFEIIAIG